MSNSQKDTIYIDIDDEITAVIDKLRNSPQKIVALVLPKRAAVFHSIVNMKLLKRTADETKRHIVLITSESALLPLAGAVGLHVAKTLQSKPEIPPVPSFNDMPAVAAEDVPLDPAAPVGKLAGLPPEDDESIEVDNSDAAPGTAKKKTKGKDDSAKKKKLKIPNFEKFRLRLILGIAALILLIGGWILAFVVLPKATLTIQTDTANLETNLNFIADVSAEAFDQQSATLPALSKEFRKTDTEKVAATGQKDVGTKSKGTVSLSTPCAATAPTIPAGTGLSTSNLGFATDEAVTLDNPTVDGSGNCILGGSVSITARAPGDQYNVGSGRTFTVAGYSAVTGANEDSFSGGTSKIVKIVTQQDIDGAKQKIIARASDDAPKELEEDLKTEGFYPLKETLVASAPAVTSTPAVNQEGPEVTVTSTAVYTMVGIKEDDLKKLVEADATKKIDPAKQVIRDNGLAKATITVAQAPKNGQTRLNIQAVVVAGPTFDEAGIKQEIAGKKRGEAQEIIKKRPGIKDVEVTYSPFWVQSTPKNVNKISVVFQSNADDSNQDQ